MKCLSLAGCAALLLLAGHRAHACFPVPIPLAERVRDASVIVSAEVISVRPMPPDAPADESGAAASTRPLQLPEPYLSHVKVRDVLKGRVPEAAFDLPVPDCGAGSAPRDARILAFKTGARWYAMLRTEEAEREVRRLLSP
ncbi:MAG: hypothetical protein HYV16_01940 [Gammaproteobacteria bacterium]|nr:hypothetical protein [Gammaproteobacteria bacterium]